MVLLLAACVEPQDRAPHSGASARPRQVALSLASLEPSAASWTSTIEYSTRSLDTLQLGDGESLFARFLPDGSLLVANGSTLMRLSQRGAFERVVARSGDGPGEFRVILGLGVADDGSLLVSDHLTGRLTLLERDGSEIRTIARLQPLSANAEALPLAVLPDGRVIAVAWQWQAAREPIPDAPRQIRRDPVPIVVYDSAGRITDTVAVLDGLERADGFVAPFARSALYGGRGGRRWVAGVSDSLDLTVYDGTEPAFRLVGPRISAPTTRRQREQRDSAVAARFGGSVGEAVVERQAAIGTAGVSPDIGGILLDDVGRIWVGRYALPGEGERRWFIFSMHGDPIGQISLPAFNDALLPLRTELLDVAGDRIALARESDGEIHIEVRRLTTDQ